MAVIRRDSDYAVRALSELARGGRDVVSVGVLAEQIRVPEEFLRKIMQRLNAHDIVSSTRGPFGGYSLARDSREISLGDVVEAVQGEIVVNECFEDPEICDNVRVCALRHRLRNLQDEIDSWLNGITLAEIVEDVPGKKGVIS
jgi:Rrf2 family protein